MSDLDVPTPPPLVGEDRQTLGILSAIIPCPRCQVDLGRLPMAARFCPNCGLDVRGSESASDAPNGHRAMQAIAMAISLPTGCDNRSGILRGYAQALFRLGRTYEENLGSRRNPAEAFRCFLKAAKLGDAEARASLDGTATEQSPITIQKDPAVPNPEETH